MVAVKESSDLSKQKSTVSFDTSGKLCGNINQNHVHNCLYKFRSVVYLLGGILELDESGWTTSQHEDVGLCKATGRAVAGQSDQVTHNGGET